MKNKILLFIPMYNCEKQIPRVLHQLEGPAGAYITEVIVVNNRSTDDGEAAVMACVEQMKPPFPVKLLRNNENYGLGGSHKVAFQYALDHGFDYLIVLHGDDQGDIANIVPYLQSEEYEGYDCFLGARFMKGSRLEGYSRFRTFGNVVYNLLFSIGCGFMVYDLGSGLNLYRVPILQDRFYIRFKDNLVFNYCMIMGSAYYKHKIRFFPIVWREDDQVSNVKMMNQAMTVLKLLGKFVINKKAFITSELRDRIIDDYSAAEVWSHTPEQ